MSELVHKHYNPPVNSELERQPSPVAVFNLQEVIDGIQASAEDPSHERRTRVLVDNPDHHLIVSGYQPGEGEDLHAHPTHNTLTFLAGTFDIWVVDEQGVEQQYEASAGTMVALERGQPHRVQARADQDKLSVVMVSIIEGMPTDTPGYSVPVEVPPTN